MSPVLLQAIFAFIPELMKIVERIITKPQSGVEKKAIVMDATRAIVTGIQSVSTGGQAETWELIAAPISGIIDNVATMLFPKDAVDAYRDDAYKG